MAALSVEAETPFPVAPAHHQIVAIQPVNFQPYVGKWAETEIVFHKEGVCGVLPDRDTLDEKAVAGVPELPVHLSSSGIPEQADRAREADIFAVGIHQPPLTEQAAGLAPFLAGGEKEDGGCQENDVFPESCHDSQF